MDSLTASDEEDEAENKHIIRRFSDKIRETMSEDPLVVSLIVKVDSDVAREEKGKYYVKEALTGMFGETAQNSKYYENEAIAKLEELEAKSKELEVTWQKFTKELRLSDKSTAESHRKPDIKTLRLVIGDAQSTIQKARESKSGRTKSFFSKSLMVLDDYNYLFDLLPDGDKYTSVFTGAFTAIIKATATHDKISTEISDAFDVISDQVRTFYYTIKADAQSAYIKYYISMFYFELFGFLIRLMVEWYSSPWKRLSRSLGSSFLENTVRGTLETLRQYSKRVKHENERRKDDMIKYQLDQLGTSVTQLLVLQMRGDKWKEKTPGAVHSHIQIGGPKDETELSLMHSSAPKWTRNSILIDVEHLKQYVQVPQEVSKLVKVSRSVSVSTELAIRVRKWVMKTSSEILWLEGPSDVLYPSQTTLTSAFMLGSLQRLVIPIIVDFIQRGKKRARSPENCEKEFVKVVYALIYQAAQVILNTVEPQLIDLDFSAPRFKKLDGSAVTLPDALALLGDILSIGPPLQFCIIDGLQLFNGRRMSLLIRKTLRDLISLLCKTVQDSAKSGRVIKILISTEGMVDELAHAAKRGELSRERFEDEEEDEMLTLPVLS